MKYKVKNNVFAMGTLNKAGTTIDIDPKYEKFYKGQIEPEAERVSKNGTNRRRKDSDKS
jgi:hypothetical protein